MKNSSTENIVIYHHTGNTTKIVSEFIRVQLLNNEKTVTICNTNMECVDKVKADLGIMIVPILGDVRVPDKAEEFLLTYRHFPEKMAVCVIGDYDVDTDQCEVANEIIHLLQRKNSKVVAPPLLLDSPFIDGRCIVKWLNLEFSEEYILNLRRKEMPEFNDSVLTRIIELLPNTPRYKVNNSGKCTMLSLETCDEYPRSLLNGLSLSQMRNLEDNINQLPELQDLRFPYSSLKEWPFSFSSFKQIKSLDLRGSHFSSYRFLEHFTHLIRLNLGANNLKEIPDSVFTLINLEILFIYKNFINEISSDVHLLKELRWLSMYRNRVEALPNELSDLTNLEILNIGANPIQHVPNLSSVRKLVLRNCNLTKLPFDINQFSSLEKLDFSKNMFRDSFFKHMTIDIQV
ncbi:hypothetical protein CN481_15665 [Bacillus sp. AFS006103]|nr:hypothetical protein CN481_15665 [Bacillus sp. AFS006103]